jgi:hypothetical protein
LIGLLILGDANFAPAQFPVSSQPTANRALSNLSSGSSGLGNSRGTTGQQNGQTGQNGQLDPTTGNDWFIHRNRGQGSFVGADPADQTGFVGAKGAMTTGSTTAVVTARVRVANPNVTLNARSRIDLYDPRLELGFESRPLAAAAISSTLVRQLNSSPSLHCSSPISVSIAGRTATMRGTVASSWDRAMAEQMVLFEPGISEVENLLTVQSPSPSDRK